MIYLRQMAEHEYQSIVDWNKNKDENYFHQWAGHTAYSYPISAEQIRMRSNSENSKIFSIFQDHELIGSVELDQINSSQLSAKICRFILCDNITSKGLGSSALRELTAIAFNEMGLQRLYLSVYCYNVGAIRCYEKCGFLVKEFHEQEDSRWNSYIMELVNPSLAHI